MRSLLPSSFRKPVRILGLAAGLAVAAPIPLLACGIGYYDPAVDRRVATGPCRDDFYVPFVCADGRNVSLLYFAQGATQLAADLRDEIEVLVAERTRWDERLPGMAPFRFELHVYADVTEVPVRTDLQFTQRRAESVRDALVTAGVPTNLISIVNFGTRPNCPNDTAPERAGNRKVEVWVASASH